MRFIEFMQNNMGEEKGDISRTLGKIPPRHSALVNGYNWKFHSGNTLNGDDEHVGYMDKGSKEIAVAAPWNYGREFTVLHEIAHRVWDELLDDQTKQKWAEIVTRTKNKQNQEPDELFCHGYAATYCKNPPAIHYHKEWVDFIKGIQ